MTCVAIVVSFGSATDLGPCLDALAGDGAVDGVVVVENGDAGATRALLAGRDGVRLVERPDNPGFAGGVNAGAAAAPDADHLVILNPDVVVAPGTVAGLVAALVAAPGVAGPVVVTSAEGGVRWHGLTVDWVGMPVPLRQPGRPPLYVQGACLATDRATFDRLGGFDARLWLMSEDMDYCWRVLLAGGEVATVADAVVDHLGGGSLGGGYVADGAFSTSYLRVAQRERNSLAVMLRCLPTARLVVTIPVVVAQTVVVAAGALLTGHGGLALRLGRGLGWNVRRLPETMALRRATPVAPGAHRRIAARRYRGLMAVPFLLRVGVPRLHRGSGRT